VSLTDADVRAMLVDHGVEPFHDGSRSGHDITIFTDDYAANWRRVACDGRELSIPYGADYLVRIEQRGRGIPVLYVPLTIENLSFIPLAADASTTGVRRTGRTGDAT
jgi:hypothetical protein